MPDQPTITIQLTRERRVRLEDAALRLEIRERLLSDEAVDAEAS